jgi:hypothetical protein
MIFPLDLLNVSLLLAIIALVLLITSELFLPHQRKANILINRKKLRKSAIAFAVLFVVTIAIRTISIILNY